MNLSLITKTLKFLDFLKMNLVYNYDDLFFVFIIELLCFYIINLIHYNFFLNYLSYLIINTNFI
jgi:hypothetical protein